MYRQLCTTAEKFLFFYKNKIYVETDIIPGCTYAYYLYENKNIVEKIPYSSSSKVCFETKPIENKNYRVKVFYQQSGQKVSVFTDNVKFNTRDLSLVYPDIIEEKISLFEIRVSNNPTKEIINTERKGFVALGRRDLPPYQLKFPINWLADPYSDRNWIFQLQAWRMLDAYLERFYLSDVRMISNIINDWVAFSKENDDKWLWYDMSTGLRALKIAYFLCKAESKGFYHGINDLNYLIKEHLIHLSNIKELSTGNHALFQLNGLMSLLFIVKDIKGVNLDDCYSFAINNMRDLLVKQLGKYGVHTEDSPEYHFFVKKKIKNILESPWWQKADTTEISNLLLKSDKADAWLLDPAGHCIPIGDSTTRKEIVDVALAEKWDHEKYKNSIGARLDGYSIVRSSFSTKALDSFYFLLQGSFYSGAHKHSDCLSVLWQEADEYILIDSGKYGYQKDNFRKYFLSSQAHNTVTVDGWSFSRRGADAYGSSITKNPTVINGLWLTQGVVYHEEKNYIHKRTVVYDLHQAMYVIDVITVTDQSNTTKRSDIFWHLEPWADVEISSGNLNIDLKNNRVKLKTSIVADGRNQKFQAEVFRGQLKPFYAGFVSKKYLETEETSTIRISSTFDKDLVIVSEFLLRDKANDGGFLFFNENFELDCKDRAVLDAIIC